jgi:hypothetical protein
VSSDVLHLTDGGGSEARSLFFNTPQAYQNGFTVHFTWDATPGTGLADGLTFLLQNDPRGVNALGVGGGSLGYAGGTAIIPSMSLQLNLYNGDGLTRGSGLRTKGRTGIYSSLGGITFGTTPIDVTMTYNPSTYQMTQTFVQGATTFSKSSPFMINGTLSGSGTALVGFTGGTGGQTSTQNISNFSYTTQILSSAPVVLRDTFTSGNGQALGLHTPEIGGQWSVPVDGGGLFITNSLIDTTGAARVARTNFTSALGPGQQLLLSLHVESIPNFFGATNFISGFDLLAGGSTKLFFGKVSSANGWSIATDTAGSNLFGSSSIIGASEIALQYTYDTGAVGLWVNDILVVSGTEQAGLALDAFGFENNNGGDVKFGNVQAAFLAVPEPSSWTLVGLGSLALLRRRREVLV